MSGEFPFGGKRAMKSLGKAVGTIAGIALGTALAGCQSDNVSFDGKQGVPLSELDLGGDAPKTLVLAGPDIVQISEGETLRIEVEGSDAMQSAMRFNREDETLAVMRSKDAPKGEKATVRVTMPAPGSLVLAGSGVIEAQGLARNAGVVITGSGSVQTAALDADALDVSIMGSGRYSGSGSVDALDLNIAGSGQAAMDGLTVNSADINIAGSGDGTFRSDGKVSASIMGSGTVTVIGRASCSVDAMGSGKLICTPG